MRAFAIDRYKGEIKTRTFPDPLPGPSEVIVATAAASVNPYDAKLRDGAFKAIIPAKMPLILGTDLAGTVVATGSGVRRFKIGDEVFAVPGKNRSGTFAERVAIDEADLALKPSRLGMIEAASLPLVAMTAWQVLVERAAVKPGDKVLIHAGSGGVGTIAIQLAKHLGATVATTTGAGNVAFVRSLGADIVIDYHSEDFSKSLRGYDVVLNTLGADVLRKSLAVLRPGGKLISISGPPDPAYAREIGANWFIRQVLRLVSFSIRRRAKARGIQYSFLMMRSNGKQLASIAELVDAGVIRPVIDRVFAFDDTPAAMAQVETGRSRGKVVIKVDPAIADFEGNT